MTSPRLWYLFLRARRTGPAAIWLLALAALTWWLLRAVRDPGLTRFALLVAPLGPAAVIGAVLRSPFDESERAVPCPLPPLRLAQLGGMLVIAAAVLALANRAVLLPGADWLLVRNGAGYVGLACLGGAMFGSPGSWGLPLACGALTVIAGAAGPAGLARWAWPNYPVADRPATAIALALLAIGLAVGAWLGSRDAPQESA